MYERGQLKVELSPDRKSFTLTGTAQVGGTNSDHAQLIYEALEIAAASDDKFAPAFKEFCKEYMELTEHWDN